MLPYMLRSICVIIICIDAKSQGKYLIVALEPDQTIVKYKKREPIHNQLQRAEILSYLAFLDEIIMLPELKGFEDYNRLVTNVCPANNSSDKK